MNSRPHQPADLSQLDTDFLVRLTNFAATIEPDPTFKVDLEAELQQAYSFNPPQTSRKSTHLMNFTFPQLNRCAALLTCASLTIVAAFIVPTLTSGQAVGWMAKLLNSTIASKANAQTIAQAIETGQVTVTADTQDYNETTQEVKAIGNASFVFPSAQIQGRADQIQYVPTARQVTLMGNVQISQRGENLRGSQAHCLLEERQCSITQE